MRGSNRGKIAFELEQKKAAALKAAAQVQGGNSAIGPNDPLWQAGAGGTFEFSEGQYSVPFAVWPSPLAAWPNGPAFRPMILNASYSILGMHGISSSSMARPKAFSHMKGQPQNTPCRPLIVWRSRSPAIRNIFGWAMRRPRATNVHLTKPWKR
jgi:hypothetical protein